MGIDFELEPLDCEPFYHGYGEHYRDAELTIGIWLLPLVDLKGNKVEIPFYITKGKGLLLLGNELLSKSDILNTRNLLQVPAMAVKGLRTEVSLPIYTTQDAELRTHLHVVPCRISKFPDFFASSEALYGSERSISPRQNHVSRFLGRSAKDFARKLHLYSHLPSRDMKALCRRGGILQPVLSQALDAAVEKSTSCNSTGRPLNVRKFSLNKPLKSFNQEVQIDYMWIKELTNNPIMHMKDNATGLCTAVIAETRDMDEAARLFEMHWVVAHGAPVAAAYDPEFDNTDFGTVLKRHDILPCPRPARKHSKIGSVESANFTLRKLTQRILKDAMHERDTMGTKYTPQEILSRAVLACNLLRGKRHLCSFELAKGYMPSIGGMPQIPVDAELIDAHLEQMTRRILTQLMKARRSQLFSSTIVPPRTKVYFFEKKTKQGIWNTGLVQDAS